MQLPPLGSQASHHASSSERLRILFTAYPLLPVNDESCGGAEQVLLRLEAEMAARGHFTAIGACSGSRAAGTVIPTGKAPSGLDRLPERELEHTSRLLEHLQAVRSSGQRYSLIHDHSGSFWRHAAAVEAPVLATLHLPRAFYPADAFDNIPPNVSFNCVSEAQRQSFSHLPRLLGAVGNGVPLQQFPLCEQKRDYLLWMGRLCPEKGAHVAIRVARSSGMKLVIAGSVYPFSYHREYFEREILPHIAGSSIQYVDQPAMALKLTLLSQARALLVTSQAEETSSVGSSRVDLQACKLEYSIVSPK